MQACTEIQGLHIAITGAAGGIGKAMAVQLAQAGAHIVVADIDRDGAEHTAQELRALGVQALAVQTDVSKAADCSAMVEVAVKTFGRLDGLICNAGIGQLKPFLELTEADIDAMLGVNVKGQIFLLQAGARAMLPQSPMSAGRPRGKIILLASIAGRSGTANSLMAPISAHYRASKAAVISLTQTAARTFAPHITVNAICPGLVDTDMWKRTDQEWADIEGLAPGQAWQRAVSAVPLGRAERAGDVADLASYLMSRGADYMTGQSINIDGGLSMV